MGVNEFKSGHMGAKVTKKVTFKPELEPPKWKMDVFQAEKKRKQKTKTSC